MLPALIRPASASRTAARMVGVPALIAIWVGRAGTLRMVLGMILRRMRCWMRRLHALLPELRAAVHAPSAVISLRRSRLRAQQQQGREKQPQRQRE